MRGPGLVLILGVILAPVYLMLAGWFLERPRNPRLALIGVAHLIAITVAMWTGGAVIAYLIGLAFF